MTKVYDCFCYFNEDMLLELRLKTLWDVVDYFVIVEATHTHAGHPKKLAFCLERFGAFQSKIRYLVTEGCPGGKTDPWANENFQRNEIRRGLFDAKPDDLIMVSDLDEIPRPESILAYNKRSLRGDFEQTYYSYFFNNQLVAPAKDVLWQGSKITLFRYFETFFEGKANSVRSFKSRGLFRSVKRGWFKLIGVQSIKNGGWHFTWISDAENIRRKIASTAHQEFNKEGAANPDRIRNALSEGEDLFLPDRRYRARPIDDTFPVELVTNPSAYAAFIKPVPSTIDCQSSHKD